jgi:cytochrome c oxidase cbb3-type subunit 3
MESKRVSVEWMGSRRHYGGDMTNSGYSRVFLLVVGLVGLAVVTAAQEKDMETVSAMPALRAEGLIIARCSVCHSADLIAQQRLPRARWEATVEKMEHWGAEISKDETDLLVRYLSARYHPGAPDRLPLLDSEFRKAEPLTQEPVAEAPLTGVAARGAGIFEHNCQACHGAMAIGGMGPKLVKTPILKHEDLFWETVLHGRGAMPGWGSVLRRQDIADIHAWLVTR